MAIKALLVVYLLTCCLGYSSRASDWNIRVIDVLLMLCSVFRAVGHVIPVVEKTC